MDLNMIRLIVVGAICVVASFIAAFSDSRVVSTALECIARQPEMENRLFLTMLLGVGLIESIPIIVVVIAFMLLGQIS